MSDTSFVGMVEAAVPVGGDDDALTAGEIYARADGVDDAKRLCVALGDLYRRGRIARTGERMHYRYYRPDGAPARGPIAPDKGQRRAPRKRLPADGAAAPPAAGDAPSRLDALGAKTDAGRLRCALWSTGDMTIMIEGGSSLLLDRDQTRELVRYLSLLDSEGVA